MCDQVGNRSNTLFVSVCIASSKLCFWKKSDSATCITLLVSQLRVQMPAELTAGGWSFYWQRCCGLFIGLLFAWHSILGWSLPKTFLEVKAESCQHFLFINVDGISWHFFGTVILQCGSLMLFAFLLFLPIFGDYIINLPHIFEVVKLMVLLLAAGSPITDCCVSPWNILEAPVQQGSNVSIASPPWGNWSWRTCRICQRYLSGYRRLLELSYPLRFTNLEARLFL